MKLSELIAEVSKIIPKGNGFSIGIEYWDYHWEKEKLIYSVWIVQESRFIKSTSIDILLYELRQHFFPLPLLGKDTDLDLDLPQASEIVEQ